MIAKYLATSLAMENVVSEPRVISNCLATSTTSISLVGLESRSTMLPASLAACVPVFIASPTSACARAGASLVPSPVIATMCPPRCSRLISASFSSGVASARKSSTPASAAMAWAVSGVVPGDHHRPDAHVAELPEPLRHPRLDGVLQVDDAQNSRPVRDHQGGPARGGDALHDRGQVGGDGAARLGDPAPVRSGSGSW